MINTTVDIMLRSPEKLSAKPKTDLIRVSYLVALRPQQWTKNLIVFAAPLFAFSINWQSFLESFLAFVLFCCASSSFYLLNDIADVKSDRRHPLKCKRPIASGLVSIRAAMGIAVVLLGGAISLGWLRSPALGATLISYSILQIAYNLKLKHIPILDIIAISIGFILRAWAGAVAIGIYLSPWFLLNTAMLTLFLGVEKRKAELRLLDICGGNTRTVLQHYSLPLLTRMESTVTTGTVMSYALWSSGSPINGSSTHWMMLTLPFVLYGIFRYQLLSDPKTMFDTLKRGENTERPEDIVLIDRPLQMAIFGWILTVFIILSLKHEGVIT